jgi:hypothetical protein
LQCADDVLSHERVQSRRRLVTEHQGGVGQHLHVSVSQVIIIINFIVSNREISINGRHSASAQLAEPGIEPRTFQLLGRRSIH